MSEVEYSVVDLGAVTAYAQAVENGYTGTLEQWAQLQINSANNYQELFNEIYTKDSSAALWEQGGLSASTGNTASSTTRIRTTDYLPDSVAKIVMNTGYYIMVYVYGNDGTFIGVLKNNYDLDGNERTAEVVKDVAYAATCITGSFDLRGLKNFEREENEESHSEYYPYKYKIVAAFGIQGTTAITPSGASNITFYENNVGHAVDNELIGIGENEPDSDRAVLWIDKDGATAVHVPEIDDDHVSDVDTWSSEKINSELGRASEDIVNIKDETLDGVFSSVTNRNLLDIYTDQSVVAGQNFNINLKNGLFYVNGTTRLIHRIKASNGIEHVTGNVPSGWAGESMGLTVGKVYYMSFIVVSGTVPTGVAVSCRNANNTTIISKSTSPVVIAEDAAYAQFYLPAGTYTNAVIVPYLIEGATGVSTYEELTKYVMRPNVIIPNYSDFYYAVPAKLSSETIHEYSSAPSDSYHVQGMATDGTYLYYSLVVDDTSNTILVKYDIANDNVVLTKADHCYGHANGMAYIPDTDKIIVCNMDQTGTISYVDPDTLEFIESESLNSVLSPVVPFWYGVGAVAYCASKKKIVFLLRGIAGADGVTHKGFAIFDSDMHYEKVCFTEYVDCESYSGLWADDDFIYLSITSPNSGSGEWLLFYDWHGTLVYQINVSGLSHLEAQAIIDGVYYFCGNNFGGINCTIVRSEVLATTAVSKIASILKYNLNY